MSKHTSGPWSIDWNVSRLDIYGGDERTVVASIRRSTLSEGIDSAARSNGRLISAAPDLLEALTLLLHEVDDSAIAGAKDYGWPVAVQKSRAALAKATGESP